MIYKNKKIKAGLLLAFLFLFALGQNASAATVTAVANGDWAAGATWSSGAAPALGDDVVIPTGITVTIGADVDAADAPRTITINGTGSLVTGTYALNVAQNAAGGIYINGTSATAFNATGANDLIIGTATFAGNLHNLSTGTVNLTGATVTMSGTLTNSEDGTLTTTAATLLTLNGSAAVVLPDEIAALHSLTVIKAGSSVTLTADLTVAAAGTLGITSGTLIVGDNNLTVGGATTIAAGATLNANSNETVTRVFTGAPAINGTLLSSGPNVTNNLTGAITLGAAGILNINNSRATIGAAPTFTAGCAIHALGTNLTYTGGAVDFANSTVNTNSNTDLTLSATDAITNFPPITDLLSLHVTTANGPTLTASLTVAGNVTIDLAGGLTIGANKLTVNGTFTNTTAAGVVASGSELVLNGPATFTDNITTNNATKITFGGSGAITGFPGAVSTVNSLTYNRPLVTTTLTADVITFDGTTPTFNVSNGTLVAAVDNQFTDEANTITTIGANGTIDFVTFDNVFLGSVTGDGTIDADQVTSTGLTFSGLYAFTGNFKTNSATEIIFNTHASDVNLNSSITELNLLTFNRAGRKITLNNDLTITAATSFDAGELDVNGYTLAFTSTYTDAGAAWTLTARNSSLVFAGAAIFVAASTYNIDETTNLEFRADPTLVANITKCNNLTVVADGAATTVTPAANLEVYGNLEIQAGCALDISAGDDLTVRGDFTNAGTLTSGTTGSTVTLYGSLQGEGTYTTDETTDIVVKGTGGQLVLPYTFGATAIGNLTIDRPSGVKLNNNLNLGAAAVTGVLTITKGNLDLNGYVLILARTGAASALIVETPGNTIINTGASGDNNGYITLTSTALTDIEPSGIGVLLATGGGATTVRRYPITIPVPDVGLSTSRVFYIENTAAVSDLTLQYDNAELYSNPADLKVYMSPSFSFATSVNVSDEANVTTASNLNTPVSGVGNVAVTGTVAVITAGLKNFYALAALPSDGGVMKKFAVASGNWGEAANWTPTGVPSKFDQAVIGASTVYLNGNGNIYECKVLNMNHAQAELKPTDNGINGDNVSLRVMGNVTVIGGAEILGVNGYGKLSLIVGDGVTAGVSSTITTNNDYVPTSGIWIHNLTINMAEVNFAQANEIRVSGNVTLKGNTFLDGATSNPNLVFWGGYGNQTITIPMSAAAQFHTLKFDNDAYVTTTASFDIKNQFTVKDGSSFIAQNGFITFPDANTNAWEVEEGGTLKLFNVVFNAAANDYTPVGTAYIQGDFTKSGGSSFKPTGTTIFSNISQREIVNASPEANVVFDKLHIAEGAKVVTSTSWQVASEIDVKSNASLIADNGVISFVNAVPAEKWIKNASTHTLEFYDLNIGAGTVYTNDSWTIHGNLDLAATTELIANNGTITFDNYQEKAINNGGNLSFFKLLVADGSKLTTDAANGNFTIANSAAYPTGAGIEIQGTGQFYVGDAAALTTFDVTGPGLAAGFPKTITKSEAGKLEFGNLVIAATPNNEVTTASDFTITGTAAAAYNNKGAGAKFLATAGTVTFTGAAPEIESVSPAVSQFYNILGKGAAAITFPNAGQEIMIAGDLILNDQSTIAPNAINTDKNNKVIFNGSGTQYIKGNTITLDAVQFGDLQINKANNSELILEIDAAIAQDDGHELTLTSGILNLGDKTFTVGAGIISRHSGVINGNAGTLIANSATDPIWLSDVYFTIDGNPTLYNLTVNAVHATANDLTVNGDLHLIADLTIASGLDHNNPKLLTLYGDLSRTAGVIDGDPANSRLVLTGTGTVENGLSNIYFNLGAATTVQLEIARQETLGGDLNIAATSHLRVNSGINNFDLGANTLTFDAISFITMISGGIKAGTGSTVDLTTSINNTPPSMFRDEECYNLTIGGDITIGGNLRVNGTLAGVHNIFTNDNVLTFGPLATLPAFTDAAHVVGNLKRYVKNNPPTVFNIGGSGDAVMYTPITLQFANSIQGQAVLIKPVYLDPTEERGGDPKYCVDAYFEIIPEGDAPVDSLKAIFQWKTDLDGGTTPSANASFPAKWTGSSWFDYRNKLQNFAVNDPRVLTMASFPIGNPAAIAGVWGIFNASENTDIAKDRAIATNRNRIAITKIDPNPVKLGLPFKTTVQLQNHLGQPLIAEEAFEVQVQKAQGNGTANLNGTTVTALIQPGKSEVTISGMMFTGGSEGDNFVLKADTTGGSLNWQMGISEPFSVIPAAPTQQAQKIKFTNIKPTSVSIAWEPGAGGASLVVMKANSLLNEDEYPVNATTYLANTIYGAGSTFGDAVVVYNDDQQQVDVTGLAPNTTYYVYVFKYDGKAGYESYNTTAAAGNPNQLVTTGSYDDDITYGINNTRALSKAIGTNTPVRGTIKSDTDEDWFNFTITSASPNLRVKLFNLPENYNVELYDQTGKRVRRSYLQNKYVDAFIMNELSAGTYSVRVYGYNGIFDAVNPYTLQVTTSSSEIFSVTP